ncbi:MAG: sigma 54-interacting transcriptional regulator [Candidatus Tectomicrobia bacterium]|nr:sigma 54-interacting transcriptional regulator [Candidatus Tectomicrobia bacterium]
MAASTFSSQPSALRLGTLQRMVKLLSGLRDLPKALNSVLTLLITELDFRRPSICLQDPVTADLYVECAPELSESERIRARYSRAEGVIGQVFRLNTPIFIADTEMEPLFLNRAGGRNREEQWAFYAVPIRQVGGPVGVLSADRRSADASGRVAEDLAFLGAVGDCLGPVIQLHRQSRVDVLAHMERSEQIQRGPDNVYSLENFVTVHPAMRELAARVLKVASSRATVLIQGESGTGKELVAHALHYNSQRSARPFVKVNCAGLPPTLLESELFGYERGAFTGAERTRRGRFEQANGGTLFLDEIGELPLPMQPKLLRAVQEGEIERLGGEQALAVDVRIIAATNRDLGQATAAGQFRDDLYYRLNVVPIFIPPLRQRVEDIPALAEHFLSRWNDQNHSRLGIDREALELLMQLPWPGNVRELENVMERVCLFLRGNVIRADDVREATRESAAFPRAVQAASPEVAWPTSRPGNLRDLRRAERDLILDALSRSKFIQTRAAQLLGMTPRQLAYRMKKYSIDVQGDALPRR